MAKVTLYQYGGVARGITGSPPCSKVVMTLAWKGIEHEVKDLQTPMEARKLNPRGRVPILKIDDRIIVDSSDIMTELDRGWPDKPLLPEGRAERADMQILEDWADEVLYFQLVYFRWLVPANLERTKEKFFSKMPIPLRWIVPIIALREVRARTEGQGIGLKPVEVVRREFSESLDALDARVEGREFLVGDSLTRADIAVGAEIDQARLRLFTPDLADEIERRSGLMAWLERVLAVAPTGLPHGE